MLRRPASRLRQAAAAVCVLACVSASAVGQSFSGQPVGGPASNGPLASPSKIVWGQEVFAIPYQWSGQTDPSQAQQVVLHLSRDAGANWRQVSVAEPRVQSFSYRAVGDGDYWFAVQTIDTAGRAWPSGPLTPELHVAVDTRIPTIYSLSATIATGGALTVACLIQDTHLDPATVRVSVQEAGGWRDLTVTPTVSADGQTVAVRATGQLAAGVPQAAIRISATDRAGNPASTGTIATLGAAASSAQLAPSAVAGQRFGFASQSVQQPIAAPASDPSAPRDPFLGQTPTFGPVSPSPQPPAAPPTFAASEPPTRRGDTWQSSSANDSPSGTIAWAPDGFSRRPYQGGSQPLIPVTPSLPSLNTQATAPRGAPNPPLSVYQSSEPRRPSGPRSTFASLSPTPPHFGAAQPGFNATSPTVRDLSTAPPSFRTAPLPEQAQFIGSRRFELDYDVASAGRWGVEKVTLWGTRDRGKTWRTFAIDSDNRSPLDVSVDEEGLYGFRITVAGVGGLTPDPPRPGDAPELWVEVDRTNPEVRLTAAHQGEGYFGDHLIINWQADDANLASRPITLSYASRPSGPWAPLASSIENNGRYTWRLQRHLPSRLYLRVEAQDTAGNTGVATTPQPLTIDLPAPTATFRTVRPIGG